MVVVGGRLAVGGWQTGVPPLHAISRLTSGTCSHAAGGLTGTTLGDFRPFWAFWAPSGLLLPDPGIRSIERAAGRR